MKLVCFFSGWCEIDTDDVKLTKYGDGSKVVAQTATDWVNQRIPNPDNLEDMKEIVFDDLILDDFSQLVHDGEVTFEELRIKLDPEE